MPRRTTPDGVTIGWEEEVLAAIDEDIQSVKYY
jgi:hypothetical protein